MTAEWEENHRVKWYTAYTCYRIRNADPESITLDTEDTEMFTDSGLAIEFIKERAIEAGDQYALLIENVDRELYDELKQNDKAYIDVSENKPNQKREA